MFKGFTYTTYVTDSFKDFFIDKNSPEILGYVIPNEPNSGYLSDWLTNLREHSLSNQTILTMLWYIYVHNNNLRKPENSKFINVDDRMLKFFHPLFAEHIDAENMLFTSTQTLLSKNRILGQNLTNEQRSYATRDDTKDNLKDEENIVRQACSYYKSI